MQPDSKIINKLWQPCKPRVRLWLQWVRFSHGSNKIVNKISLAKVEFIAGLLRWIALNCEIVLLFCSAPVATGGCVFTRLAASPSQKHYKWRGPTCCCNNGKEFLHGEHSLPVFVHRSICVASSQRLCVHLIKSSQRLGFDFKPLKVSTRHTEWSLFLNTWRHANTANIKHLIRLIQGLKYNSVCARCVHIVLALSVNRRSAAH